jgi:hypothetical protein
MPKFQKHPPLPLQEAMLNEYVQELSAPAFGSYVRLLAAVLWRKQDISKLSDIALATLTRIHFVSWKHVKHDVQKAIAETLDELQAIYTESELKLLARRKHAAMVRSMRKGLTHRATEFVTETLHAQAAVLKQGYYPPMPSTRKTSHDASKRKQAQAATGKMLVEKG